MAGFRARTGGPVDLRVVPYPAATVVVDVGEELHVVDEVTGQHQRGSVATGLAANSQRGVGRGIECLQVRLSPPVAHAVLGASALLSGAVVALDDLWGRDAARTQEQLRAAASWGERFAIAEAALAAPVRRGPGGRPGGRLRLGADRGRPGAGPGRPAGGRGGVEPQAPVVPVPVPGRHHPQARRATGPVRPRGPPPGRRPQPQPGGGGGWLRRPVPPASGGHGLRRGDARRRCRRAVARRRRRRVGGPAGLLGSRGWRRSSGSATGSTPWRCRRCWRGATSTCATCPGGAPATRGPCSSPR